VRGGQALGERDEDGALLQPSCQSSTHGRGITLVARQDFQRLPLVRQSQRSRAATDRTTPGITLY
jgi:hypothetical protein